MQNEIEEKKNDFGIILEIAENRMGDLQDMERERNEKSENLREALDKIKVLEQEKRDMQEEIDFNSYFNTVDMEVSKEPNIK